MHQALPLQRHMVAVLCCAVLAELCCALLCCVAWHCSVCAELCCMSSTCRDQHVRGVYNGWSMHGLHVRGANQHRDAGGGEGAGGRGGLVQQ